MCAGELGGPGSELELSALQAENRQLRADLLGVRAELATAKEQLGLHQVAIRSVGGDVDSFGGTMSGFVNSMNAALNDLLGNYGTGGAAHLRLLVADGAGADGAGVSRPEGGDREGAQPSGGEGSEAEQSKTLRAERIYVERFLLPYDLDPPPERQVFRFFYEGPGSEPEFYFYPTDALTLLGSSAWVMTTEDVNRAKSKVQNAFTQQRTSAPEGSYRKFKKEYKQMTDAIKSPGMLSVHYEHMLVTLDGMYHLVQLLEFSAARQAPNGWLSWLVTSRNIVWEHSWEVAPWAMRVVV